MSNPCKWKVVAYRGGKVLGKTCVHPKSKNHSHDVSDDICSRCPDMEESLVVPPPPVPAAPTVTNLRQPTRRRNRQNNRVPDEAPPKEPSLPRRILTYTEAVAKWLAAGKPERSNEEVQRIFNEHCDKCTWRRKRANICRGCGCRVAAYGMAITNKIKMATQHCPREKW